MLAPHVLQLFGRTGVMCLTAHVDQCVSLVRVVCVVGHRVLQVFAVSTYRDRTSSSPNQ